MADYVTIAELKTSLTISGTNYDSDLQRAATAASRVIDNITGRDFSQGGVGQVRWFRPVSENYLIVGDVIAIAALEVDGAVYVADTDWYLDGTDVIRPLSGAFTFPPGRRVVKVTGQWGWTTPPPEVKQAAQIIATQLFKRAREAPFGVVSVTLEGAAIRIGRTDPQVDELLARYRRSSMVE